MWPRYRAARRRDGHRGDSDKNGKRDQQPEQGRRDNEPDRRDAHHRQRVDFAVQPHRPDTACQLRARSSGDDNAGDERRELTRDRQREPETHLRFGTEDPKRVDALNRQHDTDGRCHQNDDRQRLDAGGDDLLDDVAQPYRLTDRRSAKQQVEGLRNQPCRMADEGNGLDQGKAKVRHPLRQLVETISHETGIAAVT